MEETDPSPRHLDVGIWLSRLESGVWSTPVEVAVGKQPDGSREPCWNPVLFQTKAGPLLLFYKARFLHDEKPAQIYCSLILANCHTDN